MGEPRLPVPEEHPGEAGDSVLQGQLPVLVNVNSSRGNTLLPKKGPVFKIFSILAKLTSKWKQ